MPYPLSADVAAGDITAAAHYNNLRSDALRLGQLAADGVNLGSILELYESKLNIVRLNTTQVRVEASASAPVALIVAGVPVRTVANVDLAIGDIPVGGAATWYIFANRVAGSTSFTLSVSTSPSETAGSQRRIGRMYWNGTAVSKDSIQTEYSLLLKSLLYFKEPVHQCGRLTLATGDPVPIADIASSATLFFTPYKGNRVSLYVPDYGWRIYEFAELSLDISGYTNAKNYDIFLYDNTGTLTLEGLIWSNDTLRATALYNQDGRWVKTNAKDRLYLGTIRMNAAGATADTLKARLVWNNYNRVGRSFYFVSSTSHTYNVATWRQWNADTAMKVEFVNGLAEEFLYFGITALLKSGTAAYASMVSCAVDLTSVYTFQNFISNDSVADLSFGSGGFYTPILGYHYCSVNEFQTTVATGTFGKVILNGLINS